MSETPKFELLDKKTLETSLRNFYDMITPAEITRLRDQNEQLIETNTKQLAQIDMLLKMLDRSNERLDTAAKASGDLIDQMGKLVMKEKY